MINNTRPGGAGGRMNDREEVGGDDAESSSEREEHCGEGFSQPLAHLRD